MTVAWAVFLALTGSPEAILFTVPVFLLAAPLALGRYVGEEALAGLRSRRDRVAPAVPLLPLASLRLTPGARLWAGPVAARAPPLPVR